ncbi:MAG: alkaline phosphatase family protein [Solirubrobacteraceae bacterium]
MSWRAKIALPAAIAALVIGTGLAIALTRYVRPPACLSYADRQLAAQRSRALEARPSVVPRLEHVVVIVMENKECSQVVGSPDAPFFNRVARRGALLPDFYATTHPSLPNYLALTSGSTLVARDCSACTFAAHNLIDELESAGVSWRAYLQGMPSPCFKGTRSGAYRRRHDPLMMYADIADNPARCARLVPLSELWTDIGARRLPQFAWITPNLCDDMHNCGVRAGDQFLARVVPPLLRVIGPRGVIVVTWDEGQTKRRCCKLARGGNIPTLLLGGAVRPGARPRLAYDGYSILRTIEEGFGVRPLGGANCTCTPALTSALKPAKPPVR